MPNGNNRRQTNGSNNINEFYNAKQQINNNSNMNQTNENRMRRQLFTTSGQPPRPRVYRSKWPKVKSRYNINRASLLGTTNNSRPNLSNANPIARRLLQGAPVLRTENQVVNYDKMATATASALALGIQENTANLRGNVANLRVAVAEIAKALKINAQDAKETLNMVKKNSYNKNFSKVSWSEIPRWLKHKMAVGWKTTIIKVATSPITIPYSIVKNAYIIPAVTGLKMMSSPLYKVYCLFVAVVTIYGTRVVVGMAFDSLGINEFNQICTALPTSCTTASWYLEPVRRALNVVWSSIGTQFLSNTERVRTVLAGVVTGVTAALAKIKWIMKFAGY
jgi:hypothetical protein